MAKKDSRVGKTYESNVSHVPEVKILLDGTGVPKIPEKKTDGAAAFDVYCPNRVLLEPGKTQVISLGFKVEIPVGYELKLVPRSGLSVKGVIVRNSPGTIDSDYRGDVGVILKYEPEDLVHRVDKLFKGLGAFCRNLVSAHQSNLDEARNRLLDVVKDAVTEPYEIQRGDRIGQLQLQKVVDFKFVNSSELTDTARGEGGFGSTGE